MRLILICANLPRKGVERRKSDGEESMTTPVLQTITGQSSALCHYHWPQAMPRFVAILVHGAGEHLGRYDGVAAALSTLGADVHGADHLGHGRSGGERMQIDDFEILVDDLHRVVQLASGARPGLPLVMVGHSMGGMIATRYAQRFGDQLAALALSGPLLGPWPIAPMLLAMDPMPDFPIDPQVLSRDPQVQQAYADDPLIWHGGLPRRSLEAAMRMLATIEAGPTLGPLPTLWLHGEDDQLVPPEATRQGLQSIAGGRFEQRLFPGARHEIFLETNRDEVLATLTEFVARHLKLS